MRILITCAWLVALAAPVAAQEGPLARAVAQAFAQPGTSDAARQLDAKLQAEAARDKAQLTTASWVYVTTVAADWSVTAVCLEVGCGPVNQVTGRPWTRVGPYVHRIQPELAIPLSLAIDVGALLLIREVVAPEHPTLAKYLLYGLSGVRVVWMTHQIADLRSNAVRRDRP